jgi:hypothetical protein
MDQSIGKLLSEVLLLHRWAGGEQVSLARIHGLANNVESVLKAEERDHLITEEVQEKVEDILEDVEAGQQDTSGMAIKDRLREEDIDEMDAKTIMRQCILESRFNEGVEAIASGEGSVFSTLLDKRTRNVDWFGALHYLEIIDESGHTKQLSVFSPCVPRIGEVIETHKGTPMIVTDVSYYVQNVEDPLDGGHPQRILVPTIMARPLEATEQSTDENDEA